eukprot:g11525.t1
MAFISVCAASNLSPSTTPSTARAGLLSERTTLGGGRSGCSFPAASLAAHVPRKSSSRAGPATAGVDTQAKRPLGPQDGINLRRRQRHLPRSCLTKAGRAAPPVSRWITAAAAGVETSSSSSRNPPPPPDRQRSSPAGPVTGQVAEKARTPEGGRRAIAARGARNARNSSARRVRRVPSTGPRGRGDKRKATTTTNGGTSRADGGVFRRYGRYEETNFRRRVGKMRRGAWQAVLRDLDGAEAAAAEARAVGGGLNAATVAGGGTLVTLPMYISCIRFMARERRGREAMLILGRVRAAGLEPDPLCLNFAISACGRAGLWEHALSILRGTDVELGAATGAAVGRDVYCWSSAVDACGRAGKWREAVNLIEEMQTDAGITPNAITYNAAITACRKGKQWKKAVALLREMPERGIAPNVASFSVAISALGDAGRSKDAVALFREMGEVGVEPDVMCFTAVLSACAGGNKPASQRGSWAGGAGWSAASRGGGGAGATGVGATARGSPPWEDALALLREMPAAGLEPNVVHFNAAISACAVVGRWREAVALLEEMEGLPGVLPDVVTFSAAITACGNGLKFERAVWLLRRMPEKGLRPNNFAYNAAISACAKCGRYESATALLSEMWEMKGAGVTPDAFSYSSAITACRNGNNIERASELKKEMSRRGIKGGGALMTSLLSEVP